MSEMDMQGTWRGSMEMSVMERAARFKEIQEMEMMREMEWRRMYGGIAPGSREALEWDQERWPQEEDAGVTRRRLPGGGSEEEEYDYRKEGNEPRVLLNEQDHPEARERVSGRKKEATDDRGETRADGERKKQRSRGNASPT